MSGLILFERAEVIIFVPSPRCDIKETKDDQQLVCF